MAYYDISNLIINFVENSSLNLTPENYMLKENTFNIYLILFFLFFNFLFKITAAPFHV
jgi:NADH:ubiquinone oxidoreductase subunit 2 (subunit N)